MTLRRRRYSDEFLTAGQSPEEFEWRHSTTGSQLLRERHLGRGSQIRRRLQHNMVEGSPISRVLSDDSDASASSLDLATQELESRVLRNSGESSSLGDFGPCDTAAVPQRMNPGVSSAVSRRGFYDDSSDEEKRKCVSGEALRAYIMKRESDSDSEDELDEPFFVGREPARGSGKGRESMIAVACRASSSSSSSSSASGNPDRRRLKGTDLLGLSTSPPMKRHGAGLRESLSTPISPATADSQNFQNVSACFPLQVCLREAQVTSTPATTGPSSAAATSASVSSHTAKPLPGSRTKKCQRGSRTRRIESSNQRVVAEARSSSPSRSHPDNRSRSGGAQKADRAISTPEASLEYDADAFPRSFLQQHASHASSFPRPARLSARFMPINVGRRESSDDEEDESMSGYSSFRRSSDSRLEGVGEFGMFRSPSSSLGALLKKQKNVPEDGSNLQVAVEGGQSDLVLATDLHENKLCMIKSINMDVFKDAEREVRIIKQIKSHPNVIRMHAAWVTDKFLYIANEFAESGDLARKIKKNGPLQLEECLRLFAGILAGVKHCHSCGVVHLDIKPENILLTKNFVPKLADFGHAVEIARYSLLKWRIPTRYYSSPERIRQVALSVDDIPKTDVWSLGVLLFAALTGRFPYDEDFLSKIRDTEKFALAELKPTLQYPNHIPNEAKILIDRMLCPLSVRMSLDDVMNDAWIRPNIPHYDS